MGAESKLLQIENIERAVITGVHLGIQELDVIRLLESGNSLDRAGFTKVGRGLMKHGYREGSCFSKPLGNPVEINKQGAAALKEILSDPGSKGYLLPDGSIKVYAPDGRGAFFRKDGTFKGFIELQYE